MVPNTLYTICYFFHFCPLSTTYYSFVSQSSNLQTTLVVIFINITPENLFVRSIFKLTDLSNCSLTILRFLTH